MHFSFILGGRLLSRRDLEERFRTNCRICTSFLKKKKKKERKKERKKKKKKKKENVSTQVQCFACSFSILIHGRDRGGGVP